MDLAMGSRARSYVPTKVFVHTATRNGLMEVMPFIGNDVIH